MSNLWKKSLMVYVPDIDAHFEAAVAAGSEVILPPQVFWSGRIYRTKDAANCSLKLTLLQF